MRCPSEASVISVASCSIAWIRLSSLSEGFIHKSGGSPAAQILESFTFAAPDHALDLGNV